MKIPGRAHYNLGGDVFGGDVFAGYLACNSGSSKVQPWNVRVGAILFPPLHLRVGKPSFLHVIIKSSTSFFDAACHPTEHS